MDVAFSGISFKVSQGITDCHDVGFPREGGFGTNFSDIDIGMSYALIEQFLRGFFRGGRIEMQGDGAGNFFETESFHITL
jgi:hypothetical protein